MSTKSQRNLNQLNTNSKLLKIIQYTLENYFNILIDNFPKIIKQKDKSFYISFYMKKCSCEKKTHKNKFHIIFNIKEGVDLSILIKKT